MVKNICKSIWSVPLSSVKRSIQGEANGSLVFYVGIAKTPKTYMIHRWLKVLREVSPENVDDFNGEEHMPLDLPPSSILLSSRRCFHHRSLYMSILTQTFILHPLDHIQRSSIFFCNSMNLKSPSPDRSIGFDLGKCKARESVPSLFSLNLTRVLRQVTEHQLFWIWERGRRWDGVFSVDLEKERQREGEVCWGWDLILFYLLKIKKKLQKWSLWFAIFQETGPNVWKIV